MYSLDFYGCVLWLTPTTYKIQIPPILIIAKKDPLYRTIFTNHEKMGHYNLKKNKTNV